MGDADFHLQYIYIASPPLDDHVCASSLESCNGTRAMKELLLLSITYAVAVAASFLIFSAHVQKLAHPQEKSFLASSTTALTLTFVVASLCLPAFDVALLSSTNVSNLGVRKDSISEFSIQSIEFWLKVVYLVVHSLTAFLVVVATPFSWVFFEEWDDESSNTSRAATALKWTAAILITFAVVFALGLVLPAASRLPLDTPKGVDLEYLKDLLASSKPTKSLLFALGLLTCLGTTTIINYLAPGLATLPLSLLKSQSIQTGESHSELSVDLELNRQQQRQIELRYEGTRQTMPIKERKALEALQRRERATIRSQRLSLQTHSRVFTTIIGPLHYMTGLLFLIASGLIMIVLGITLINDLFIPSGKQIANLKLLLYLPYQVSFALHLLCAIYLVLALTNGIQNLSLRFLWLKLYSLSASKSLPQALLSYSLMSALSVTGLQVLVIKVVGPEYIVYGSQTTCTGSSSAQCAEFPDLVKRCYGRVNQTMTHDAGENACTKSVISRIFLSMETNYPIFRVILDWGLVAVVGVFICSFVVVMFKKARGYTDKSDDEDDDDHADIEQHREVNERSRLL